MSTDTGTLIRTTRENLGLSQRTVINTVNKNFGKDYRISSGHFSEVEQGKKGISLAKLHAITWALLQLGSK